MATISIDVSDRKGLGGAVLEKFYSCAHVETLHVWVQVQGGGEGKPKRQTQEGGNKLTVRRLVNEKPCFMLLPIPIVIQCDRRWRADDGGSR